MIPPEISLARTRDSRRHPALTDGPTGLPNRLHFDVVFRVAFWFGHRGIPVSLLILDVPAMEGCSTEAARTLGARMAIMTRRTDLMARIDDTRLAALLLDCNVHGGLVAADRFQGELATWCERHGHPFRAGLASYHQAMSGPEDLFAAADRALRAATATGESGRIEVESGPR